MKYFSKILIVPDIKHPIVMLITSEIRLRKEPHSYFGFAMRIQCTLQYFGFFFFNVSVREGVFVCIYIYIYICG